MIHHSLAKIFRNTDRQFATGPHGKIAVHLAGTKEGLWYDFASGTGGNMLQLVQHQKGLSFKEAVDYCAWFLNISPDKDREIIVPNRSPDSTIEDLRDKTARLKAVETLYRKAQPLADTPAERYLRHARTLQGDLPSDLRFLPRGTAFHYNDTPKCLSHNCLASFGRDAQGALCVVQLTKLKDQGLRAQTKDGKALHKIQYGIAKRAFVTLQSDSRSNQVFIAEGVETALSIKEAGVHGTIIASLGVHNISTYTGPEVRVMLCADNDGPKATTNDVILRAERHFEAQGKDVTVIRPQQEGYDFNDVLKQEGQQAVRAYLSTQARSPETCAVKTQQHGRGL